MLPPCSVHAPPILGVLTRQAPVDKNQVQQSSQLLTDIIGQLERGPPPAATQVRPPVTQVRPHTTQVRPHTTQVRHPVTQVRPHTTQVRPPVTQVRPPVTQVRPHTTQV